MSTNDGTKRTNETYMRATQYGYTIEQVGSLNPLAEIRRVMGSDARDKRVFHVLEIIGRRQKMTIVITPRKITTTVFDQPAKKAKRK